MLNLKQGIKSPFVTEFGELTTASRLDDVAVTFHYGISTFDVKNVSTGTGNVTAVGSDASITCGTGTGDGVMESLNSVRYRAGHEVLAMATHDQTHLQTGVDVLHGVINSADGVAIGSKDTDFGVWFVEDSNETFTPASSFNVDKLDGTGRSGFVIDSTKRNLFAMTYGYLSIAPIRFYIATEQGWVEFHNINKLNAQSVGHLKNPTLPMCCRVRRSSGAGDAVTVKIGSWRGGTLGESLLNNPADKWFDFRDTETNLSSINTTTDPNLYHNLISLKSATMFNSNINHIRSELANLSVAVDANKNIELVVIKNGVLVGNSAFVDRNTGESVMSTSTGGTVDGQVNGVSSVIAKVGTIDRSIKNTGVYVRPGDIYSVAARGVNGSGVTGDVSVAIRWVEEF